MRAVFGPAGARVPPDLIDPFKEAAINSPIFGTTGRDIASIVPLREILDTKSTAVVAHPGKASKLPLPSIGSFTL
jgi:hypothetical protein